jgi:hypothetical protein
MPIRKVAAATARSRYTPSALAFPSRLLPAQALPDAKMAYLFKYWTI